MVTLTSQPSFTQDDLVHVNKKMEELCLRRIESLAAYSSSNPRWLNIAKTHIEQAFMAMNRGTLPEQSRTTLATDNPSSPYVAPLSASSRGARSPYVAPEPVQPEPPEPELPDPFPVAQPVNPEEQKELDKPFSPTVE